MKFDCEFFLISIFGGFFSFQNLVVFKTPFTILPPAHQSLSPLRDAGQRLNVAIEVGYVRVGGDQYGAGRRSGRPVTPFIQRDARDGGGALRTTRFTGSAATNKIAGSTPTLSKSANESAMSGGGKDC